ncbi:hypothetical protein ES703_90712 [subsurface metagenome]
MKEKSDQTSCPICKNIVFKRGLFGHLRMAHEKTPEEAHEYMSTQVHESLPEKTSEKAHEYMSTQVHESLPEKTSDELKKEIAENKEAMADLENKPAKDLEKKELIIDPDFHTTKPPFMLRHRDCPFCESEKTNKEVIRHIAAKHKISGVTLQDLDDVEKGLKSLPDLVCEKFEGDPMIANLSPEIEEKYFSAWDDVEENPSEPEDLKDPEDLEDPEEEASQDPDDKKELEIEPEERRKINLIPHFFFSPFDRRGRQ